MKNITHAPFATALAMSCLAYPAYSQSPLPTGDSETADNVDSGDIVVTAQRRAERLQDVPISISAFTADQIEARGIVNALAIAQYIPNMVATNNTGLGSANTYYIRGLGNTESIPTFDPPVGTYLDEVYVSRQNANNLSLFDVERVEVLRGPQGTLFGRNTTGGAMSIVMAKPELGETSGFGEVAYGSYDQKRARATINVPLADSFSVKFSGYWQNDDGYVHNVTTGQTLNDRDGWGARLGMRGELAPWAHWNAAYTYIVDNSDNALSFTCNPVNPSQCDGRYATTGMLEGRHVYPGNFSPAVSIKGRKANFGLGNFVQSQFVTSNLNFDVTSKINLAFITGFINQKNQYAFDYYDGRSASSIANPVPAVGGYRFGGYSITSDGVSDQFSQEMKLSGSLGDGLIDFVTGAYYMKERVRSDWADIFGTSRTTALLLADRVMTNTTKALAGYAQGDLNLTPRIKLTAGVRYTEETKTISYIDNLPSCNDGTVEATCLSTSNFTAANGVAIPDKLIAKKWTPRFAINYKASTDLLVYASATKGFKSGGWNARATTPATAFPFNPEIAWSYEVGMKAAAFDRKLQANLSLFWLDVSDLQIPSALILPNGSTSFLTRNFADFRNRGIELELQFRPVKGLNLFANGGFSDADYKVDQSKPATDLYGTQSVAAQQALCRARLAAGNIPGGTGMTSICPAGIVTPNGDIAAPVRVPEFTLALGASYELLVGKYSVTPRVDANWHSNYEVGTSNSRIYLGSITGTNGTFPANPYSGELIGGSLSKAAWLVNAGLSFGDKEQGWSLTADCSNCLNSEQVQSSLGFPYLNDPVRWTVRARIDF